MCGIAGWINYQRDLRVHSQQMSTMVETLRYRGPDDKNIHAFEHALLGHTRLVVVDPEGGKQPMTKKHASGTTTIIYNGELYNTEDVRKELQQRGHHFRSHSDTEVLLAAYIEWKEACVEKINGIFAFAVWEHETETLFLARDRLGVKPLFYAETPAGFLFASELKTILAHEQMEAVIDEEGLHELFALGPSHTPGKGVFRGIQELRPGHTLRLDRSGKKVTRYWNVTSAPHTDSEAETAAKVRELLEDSVTRQLVADVPVATFLSGGVDSSALTAMTANEFKKEGTPLHTFSIDYEGNDEHFKANDFQPASDADFIKQMTAAFDTHHHKETISIELLADYLEKAVEMRDLPGMADIDSSLLWFCERIKNQATVALSGECADEIFGGYPWFYKEELLNRKGFPWMTALNERASLLDQGIRKSLDLEGYAYDRYKETVKETPRLKGESKQESRRRELFYLNMIWFMTTLLERKDRMSMGASLEVRVPFADHRLVEYVWNIPWEMKRLNGMEKGILRKALEGLLPNDVLYRKKSPYPKTHNPVYTKMVTERVKRLVDDPQAPIHQLIDRHALKDLAESGGASYTKPWFGQLMTGPQLLAYMIQLNHWLKTYDVKIKL